MNLSGLKEALGRLVALAPGLSQVEVLAALPAGSALPLSGPAVFISIESVELTPGGFGCFNGSSAGESAAVVVRFDFFSTGKSGSGLDTLYEALCAVLLEQGVAFGLSRVCSERTTWDDMAGSYRRSARVQLNGRARSGTGREEPAKIEGFELRGTVVDS